MGDWKEPWKWRVEKLGKSGRIRVVAIIFAGLTLISQVALNYWQLKLNREFREISEVTTRLQAAAMRPQISATLDSAGTELYLEGDDVLLSYKYTVDNFGTTPAFDLSAGVTLRAQREFRTTEPRSRTSFDAEVSTSVYPGQKFPFIRKPTRIGRLADYMGTKTTFVAIHCRFRDVTGLTHYGVFDYFLYTECTLRPPDSVFMQTKLGPRVSMIRPLHFQNDTLSTDWNAVTDSLFPTSK